MKKKELTLEIWDNGHCVNASLINYDSGQQLIGVSGKTEEDVFEKLGDYFLGKAGIVRHEPKEKCGVF